MYYLGVKSINAARSLVGFEPVQVMAMTARLNRRYGGDVDESAAALIRFPDGVRHSNQLRGRAHG